MPAKLTYNSYGKSKVRLTKVVRQPSGQHDLFEIDAAVQLEGDFAAAYTAGDNRLVVATDTIKNTVYVVAKENAFTSIEQFGLILAQHFLKTYAHVSAVKVELEQASWRRIEVGGTAHAFSFTSDGPQKRTALVKQDRTRAADVTGGVSGLQVLKTTASEWRDFHKDRYRTLKDTSDRILATTVDATWVFAPAGSDFNAAYAAITGAILTAFATQHSLGAQQTIMHMGEAALAACRDISSISFALPNQHRIPFNLEPFGLKFENDIFVATDEPHGLIHGTVSRD